MEIGIALDPSTLSPDDVVALARRADDRGVDVVAVDTASASSPWALATWIAGVTGRIRLAVEPALAEDPSDATGMNAQVAEKARLSLEALAPDRLLRSAVALTRVTAGIDDASLRKSARHGIPVVPVTSVDAIDRVAEQRAVIADLPAPRPQRRPEARSKRMPGIVYDDVPISLAATAVEPGDPEHRGVASTYLRGGDPGLVLRPRTVEQVSDALAFARDHRHVPLSIRSAGHGISGRSTNRGGLVIDVGALRDIEVLDEETRRVRIGPGATWKAVAQALAPRGWALGSGDYGGVGVGGLATAGGIGFLSRKHGLTIDHVRAIDLVLADGTPVRASDTENPTSSGRSAGRGRTSASPRRSSSRRRRSAWSGGRNWCSSPTTSRRRSCATASWPRARPATRRCSS